MQQEEDKGACKEREGKMRPEEAIEILELDKNCDFEGDTDTLVKAHDMGIEALKRCKWNYENPQRADFRLLPSETYIPQNVSKLPSDEEEDEIE